MNEGDPATNCRRRCGTALVPRAFRGRCVRRHRGAVSVRGRLGRDHRSAGDAARRGGATTAIRATRSSSASARSMRCRPTACRAQFPSLPTSSTPGPAPPTSASARCSSTAPMRSGKPNVVAFTADVPALGLLRRLQPADGQFECPCHESAFAKDGQKLFGPSLRGLDPLAREARRQATARPKILGRLPDGSEPGIAERKPVG